MTMRSLVIVGVLLTGVLGGWTLSSVTSVERTERPNDVLATVGGQKLTRADVEQVSHEAFLGLKRQRQDLTEQSLVQAVRIKLVEVEAAARGISPQDLVQVEVFDKTPVPTEDEVRGIYQRSGTTAPFDQVASQIAASLKSSAREKRYDEFLQELRERYRVVNQLEPMRATVTSEGYASKGPENAPVTIVEFADFQCPYCKQLVGVLGQVMAAYPEEIRFVYRHFPLTNIHPGAQVAAEASLCMDDQGKFWEAHDELYANPSAISIPYLKQLARRLGADGERFDTCLDSGKFKEQVAADVQEGRALGITGTPGLFINGRFISGVPEAEKIVDIVLDELSRAGRDVARRPLEPIRVAVDADGFPSRGPAHAPVTIVEFSDFQCPFCLRILPSLQKVLDTYGDQVRFVYRQYPISQIHPEAQKASEASLCAQDQGRFWEMHDAMFADQTKLDVPSLKSTARSLGMQGAQFDQCLDSGKYAAQTLADFEAGRRAGVSGTPALFINGRMLGGLQGFEAISAIVEDELSRARK